ncbi:MAG: protein kinase [Planctomycetes bacterium]|nr:protein kinase [Planctomycetota bacterium]
MSDRYQQAKDLFLKVCDLKPSERAAILDKECVDDPDLRAEVESLLAHRDAPTVSLEFDSSLESQPISNPDDGPKRTHIGSYRVIHELGKGGMGVVYLAVSDDKIKHRVAIKVVKRGMDTEQVLQRFELERQLLSAMNHPGIARFIDAGQTEDGLPYLVMEYVEGQPIDEYCNVRRLDINERLVIFRKVCAAVHYAHQNLVVHRDLKPSNIIVSPDGEPKLLDFGIAKLLNPELSIIKGDPTAPEFRVMTPEYASPEQVRGYPLTTVSDVYSLGVLLYELMSGHRPYHLRSRVQAEIVRAICEDVPEKPSTSISRVESTRDSTAPGTTATVTPESVSKERESRPEKLKKLLAGDIDNIVLMAMRKEPQRRYSSAEQLSDDIGRHLDGLPVISCGDSLSYRFNKFVHRHRMGVAAALVIALSLMGGIIGTTWQAQIAANERDIAQQAQADEIKQRQLAETERAKADRRFDQVRSLANTFMYDFHDAIVKLEGSIPARQLLVTTALEYLDNLAQEVGDNVELKRELASAYDHVGQIRMSIRNPSVGDISGALENYRKGLGLRQELLTASPKDQILSFEVSVSRLHIADMLMLTGDSTEAVAEYREVMRLRELLLSLDSKWKRHYSLSINALGKALLNIGKIKEAKKYYFEYLAISEELAAETPGDIILQRDLSIAYFRIAGRLARVGDNQGALDFYLRALGIRKILLEKDPDTGRAKRDLASAHLFLSQTYVALNNMEAATEHCQQCISIYKKRVLDSPKAVRPQFNLALGLYMSGNIDFQIGNWEQARTSYLEFNSVIEPLSNSRPKITKYRQYLAVSFSSLGDVAVETDDPNGAISDYRKALEIFESLVAKDPDDVRWPSQRARAQLKIGSTLLLFDDFVEARSLLLSAQETFASLLKTQAEDVEIRGGVVTALKQLAKLSAKQNKIREAQQYVQDALLLLDDAPELFETTELRKELNADLDRYRNENN